MNKAQAQAIYNKRKMVGMSLVGRLIGFQIVGNPTTIPVIDKEGHQVFGSDGQPLMKVIYNTNLNSQIALHVPDNKELLKKAAAGDEEAANAWLNSQQISFSHIGDTPRFTTRQSVEGVVQLVTTERGSLLTIDPSTICAVKAATLQAAPAITLEDLLGSEDEKTEA